MRTSITQALLQKFKTGADAWIYDTQLPGFVLRVRSSGRHSYLALLGRGKWYTIGRADVLKPEEARKLAQGALGDIAHGKDPIAEKRKERTSTFAEFLTQHYEPWLLANRKSGEITMARLRGTLKTFSATKLGDFTAFGIERWRSTRLKEGVTAATVNRDIGALKSALHKAVQWKLLTRHPLADVKLSKIDTTGKVRYLTADEEHRLRKALDARDSQRRRGRDSANAWRRERGYDEWPAYGTYTDHLTPLVLLAMNTGLRFGELTGMKWADVDLLTNMLTVRADSAKAGKARYVPLNAEAVKVLKAWKADDVAADVFLFPGKTEAEPLVEIKTAWSKLLKAAKIERFRFHDTRHHFASRLVQAGVDLNTVRELLGHADTKMTLRYAHLAPEHKAAAVAKLVAV